MVLPAAGAALCWLLLMSLWLPLLNFARSYAPLVQKVQGVTGSATCLQYAGLSQAQGTAFVFHAKIRLQQAQTPSPTCPWLIIDQKNLPLMAEKIKTLGWEQAATAQRPSDSNESILIFRPAQERSDGSLSGPPSASR